MDVNWGTRLEGNIWLREDTFSEKGNSVRDPLTSNGVDTIIKLFDYAVAKWPDNICLATRKLLSRTEYSVKGTIHEKLDLGEYQCLTYIQVQKMINNVSNYFSKILVKPKSMIALFSETRAEWLLVAFGCIKAGHVIVSLYNTLGDEGILELLTDTNVDTICVSHSLLSKVCSLLPNLPNISRIIVFEDPIRRLDTYINISELSDKLHIIPFTDLLKDNEEVEEAPISLAPDDVIIVMYTSGSSGHPKGVEITHTNMIYSVLGYHYSSSLFPGAKYIAYLPLAHIMEFLTEMSVLAVGASLYFSSPGTLTSKSVKIQDGCCGDINLVKPNNMTAVPLVLDRLINEVLLKAESGGIVTKTIFNVCFFLKTHMSEMLYKLIEPLTNFLIFNKTRSILGGNLNSIVVGGALLCDRTQDLARKLFDCKIQPGYGATETTASATSQNFQDNRIGSVGCPNYKILVKLENWAEAGYTTKDKPRPRGEIIIGGPSVAMGYYNNPEKTKACFDMTGDNRWFRTGDIGEFDETGVLYIIDRKKDLVKLSNGEYVALGEIESSLKSCVFIESICAIAQPGAKFVVAIIVPNLKNLKNALKSDVPFINTEDINSHHIKAFLLSNIRKCCREQNLPSISIPKDIYITTTPWTPGNGLVTPSNKIIRHQVADKFEKEIKTMYNDA